MFKKGSWLGVVVKSKCILNFILSLFLVGCSDGSDINPKEDEITCTTSFEPGISVQVFDQETGLPIACGASLTIGDGDFAETIIEVNSSDIDGCVNSGALQGAFEREGFYSLIVSKLGYIDHTASDIEVTSNECHVNTVSMQVYLTK
jgi:hypothetical protein